MTTVTISPKFQIVIPKEIRERMKLVPGKKFHVMDIEDRIVLVPERPIRSMRGFAKGMDANFIREEEDRY